MDVDIPPEYRAIRYVCKEIYGKVKKSNFTSDTLFDIRFVLFCNPEFDT